MLDNEVEDHLFGKPRSQPLETAQSLGRQWEVVTVRELCRRLSLDDTCEPGEMPLPQGSSDSQILDVS